MFAGHFSEDLQGLKGRGRTYGRLGSFLSNFAVLLPMRFHRVTGNQGRQVSQRTRWDRTIHAKVKQRCEGFNAFAKDG
jgi:hypothetical protein